MTTREGNSTREMNNEVGESERDEKRGEGRREMNREVRKRGEAEGAEAAELEEIRGEQREKK